MWQADVLPAQSGFPARSPGYWRGGAGRIRPDRDEGAIVSTDDKAKHKLEKAKGKTKEGFGKATDDKRTEREGKADQAKSDLKQAGDKAKDAFKH
jgi:uncharacterized protein YjbJ (UPF0337 family)